MFAALPPQLPPQKRPLYRVIIDTLERTVPEMAGFENPLDPRSFPNVEDDRHRARIAGFSFATSKLLFVIVPLLINAIVLVIHGHPKEFLTLSEWSILATVVNGQTIVKLSSAVLGRRVVEYQFQLIQAAFIALVFIPSVMVLVFILMASPVSLTMQLCQLAVFLVSAAIFWIVTWLNTSIRVMEVLMKATMIEKAANAQRVRSASLSTVKSMMAEHSAGRGVDKSPLC